MLVFSQLISLIWCDFGTGQPSLIVYSNAKVFHKADEVVWNRRLADWVILLQLAAQTILIDREALTRALYSRALDFSRDFGTLEALLDRLAWGTLCDELGAWRHRHSHIACVWNLGRSDLICSVAHPNRVIGVRSAHHDWSSLVFYQIFGVNTDLLFVRQWHPWLRPHAPLVLPQREAFVSEDILLRLLVEMLRFIIAIDFALVSRHLVEAVFEAW